MAEGPAQARSCQKGGPEVARSSSPDREWKRERYAHCRHLLCRRTAVEDFDTLFGYLVCHGALRALRASVLHDDGISSSGSGRQSKLFPTIPAGDHRRVPRWLSGQLHRCSYRGCCVLRLTDFARPHVRNQSVGVCRYHDSPRLLLLCVCNVGLLRYFPGHHGRAFRELGPHGFGDRGGRSGLRAEVGLPEFVSPEKSVSPEIPKL